MNEDISMDDRQLKLMRMQAYERIKEKMQKQPTKDLMEMVDTCDTQERLCVQAGKAHIEVHAIKKGEKIEYKGVNKKFWEDMK